MLKHPLDINGIFFPSLEIGKLRGGTFCASQSKQRWEGAAAPLRGMLLSEGVVLGGWQGRG